MDDSPISQDTLAVSDAPVSPPGVAEVSDAPDPTDIALLVVNRLDSKRKELEEYEKKIDKKIGDFKKFLQSTEITGRAQITAPHAETPKEYKDRIMRGA